MSEFKVTFEKIGSLNPIPGADKIEMATLEGMAFIFVVKKGVFNVGDTGVYFPVDSVLPDALIEKIGMVGKLSGGNKNCVRTVNLRGMPSQGLFLAMSDLGVSLEEHGSIDLTQHFGVIKHEIVEGNMDAKSNLPAHLSKYDIESAQRYGRVLESFDIVMVTEKIEGQPLAAGVKYDDSTFVCSRSFELKPEGETTGGANNWHLNVRNNHLYEKAKLIKEKLGCSIVTIYGESAGPKIQGDYYNFGCLRFFCFDIKIDNDFVDPMTWHSLCVEFGIPIVPILFTGKLSDFLEGKSIVEKANGKSQLNTTKLREGIVIKAITKSSEVGHIPLKCARILKVRDPIYLGETGAE